MIDQDYLDFSQEGYDVVVANLVKILGKTEYAYLIESEVGIAWYPKSVIYVEKNNKFSYAAWFEPNYQEK